MNVYDRKRLSELEEDSRQLQGSLRRFIRAIIVSLIIVGLIPALLRMMRTSESLGYKAVAAAYCWAFGCMNS